MAKRIAVLTKTMLEQTSEHLKQLVGFKTRPKLLKYRKLM